MILRRHTAELLVVASLGTRFAGRVFAALATVSAVMIGAIAAIAVSLSSPALAEDNYLEGWFEGDLVKALFGFDAIVGDLFVIEDDQLANRPLAGAQLIAHDQDALGDRRRP